jgi:hypothetical protein
MVADVAYQIIPKPLYMADFSHDFVWRELYATVTRNRIVISAWDPVGRVGPCTLMPQCKQQLQCCPGQPNHCHVWRHTLSFDLHPCINTNKRPVQWAPGALSSKLNSAWMWIQSSSEVSEWVELYFHAHRSFDTVMLAIPMILQVLLKFRISGDVYNSQVFHSSINNIQHSNVSTVKPVYNRISGQWIVFNSQRIFCLTSQK